MKRMRWLAVALAIAGALSACGSDSGSEAQPGTDAPESITGIVVDIESGGLNEVSRFELKDGDETFTILIDEEVDYGFPLGHLSEHMSGALPVKVDIEERDGDLYAQTIEDA